MYLHIYVFALKKLIGGDDINFKDNKSILQILDALF